MKSLNLAIGLAIIIGLKIHPAVAAETEASVKVQSVRVSRFSPAQQTKFGPQYYSDISPGVSIGLLLEVDGVSFLTPGRDAIAIDTFVDDTYSNLLVNNQYGGSYYGGQPPRVSADGSSLMFSVSSSQSPADEAGRVFVRGKIKARASRGTPKVQSAVLPLFVGQGTRVGTFVTSLRSMTANGNPNATGFGNNVTLNLNVFGDSSRILKVRALDRDDSSKVLSDPKQTSFSGSQTTSEIGPQTGTAYITLLEPATNSIMIELTIAENVETISIPFEAQVDFGVAKAGPVTTEKTQIPAASRTRNSQPWPPPAATRTNQPLPQPRPPFVPRTNSNPTSPPANR